MIEVAFDIGGTFTDFVLRDTETGRTDIWKVPTTSRHPAEAVVAGLGARVADGSLTPSRIVRASHATTIATNAILERKGSRTALLTTAGFRDILLIGRQKRYDTNSLHIDKPKPLVERADILEVAERVTPDGSVLLALTEAEAAAVADRVARGEYESVAIVFLHAYANAAHEELHGDGATGAPARRAIVALVRDRAEIPRIRADQHHRRQRLCRPDGGRVSLGADRLLARAGDRHGAVDHAVERRRRLRRPRPRPSDPDRRIRPRRRRADVRRTRARGGLSGTS